MTPEELDEIAKRLSARVMGEMSRLLDAKLPTVLSRKEAARELSISLTKLKDLVRKGLLLENEVDGKKGIPRSEVLRLAQPKAPKSGARRGKPKAPEAANTGAALVRAALKKR